MKDTILQITDKTKDGRLKRIRSLLKREHFLQVDGDLVNIIVPAREQKGKIALVAHHDVLPGSYGYNDNSTGVVSLLKMQFKVPDNVEIVFTDGEERGGRGCELYLTKSVNPRMAINLDVVGLGDKIFYEEYGPKGKIRIGAKDPMEYYRSIPFSDSYILNHFNVPNILILTGSSHDSLIDEIWKAQHNGPNDGKMELINEDVMQKVQDVVLKILERNK